MGYSLLVSPTHLQSALSPYLFEELIESCERHAISARLSVESDGWPGTVELVDGRAVAASYQNRMGPQATELLRKVDCGDLEVHLDSAVAAGTPDQVDLIDISLNTVTRCAEDCELSGTIAVGNGQELAEFEYSLGYLSGIAFDGAGTTCSLAEIAARFRRANRPVVIQFEEESDDWEASTQVYQRALPGPASEGAGHTAVAPPTGDVMSPRPGGQPTRSVPPFDASRLALRAGTEPTPISSSRRILGASASSMVAVAVGLSCLCASLLVLLS